MNTNKYSNHSNTNTSNQQQNNNHDSNYPSNKELTIGLSLLSFAMFIYFLFDTNIL